MSEMILAGVIAALLICNVLQLLYWSRHTQGLVDKLMSRNYVEYVQGQIAQSNVKSEAKLPPKQEIEHIPPFEDPAEILNQQMGFS